MGRETASLGWNALNANIPLSNSRGIGRDQSTLYPSGQMAFNVTGIPGSVCFGYQRPLI